VNPKEIKLYEETTKPNDLGLSNKHVMVLGLSG
jgi:hypothetical protein